MNNITHRLIKLNRFHFAETWKNWLIRVTYFFLQQTDLILTTYALSHGFMELNPVLHNIIASPLELILIKAIIPLILAIFVPPKLLIPACVLLLFVNGWDISLLIL